MTALEMLNSATLLWSQTSSREGFVFHFPKSAENIVTSKTRGMIGCNMSSGYTSISTTRQYPPKMRLESDRRSCGSDPPAMKQHSNKDVHTEEEVDFPGVTKSRIGELKIG
jgi:hypothetical protein